MLKVKTNKKKYFESRNTKGYQQNNLPHEHSVKTNKKKYFESRNTKGYKQNNLPHERSVKTNKKKYILRAGIPKGINRITFLMYAQSQTLKSQN
jgi:hypothetical protein